MIATPFAERLVRAIRHDGPLRLDWWMAMVNEHYYATGTPLGDGGDFLTAPEAIQAFGETLGLWLAEAWRGMGSPASFTLAELGAGRGTLMRDILRAAGPAFVQAARVLLVETSPKLRQAQTAAVPGARHAASWEALPADTPLLLIANEFLDALPARQFVRTGAESWRERHVALARDGGFAIADLPSLAPADAPADAPDGAIVEDSPAANACIAFLAERAAAISAPPISAPPMRALFIDYACRSPWGDTLHAIRNHQPANPLTAPGACDLSTRVNFTRLALLARRCGAQVFGPVPQAAMLEALGFGQRCAALAQAAPQAREAIAQAQHRLTADDAMGTLFQALEITSPGLAPPPWGLGTNPHGD